MVLEVTSSIHLTIDGMALLLFLYFLLVLLNAIPQVFLHPICQSFHLSDSFPFFFFFSLSLSRYRFDSDYLYSLGRTILELAKVTPSGEGIVIYVSSYEFQDMCALNWQKCAPNKKSLWDTIAEYKVLLT